MWYFTTSFLQNDVLEGFHSVIQCHQNCYGFGVRHVGVHAVHVLWRLKSIWASHRILTDSLDEVHSKIYWMKLWWPGSLCEIWNIRRRPLAKVLASPLSGCHPHCAFCGIVCGRHASTQDLQHHLGWLSRTMSSASARMQSVSSSSKLVHLAILIDTR